MHVSASSSSYVVTDRYCFLLAECNTGANERALAALAFASSSSRSHVIQNYMESSSKF
jgi:hypothetical protein